MDKIVSILQCGKIEIFNRWRRRFGDSVVDLSDANLGGANLSDANLSDADLCGAYLSDAYLRGANLSDADLRDANLGGANLRGANLRWANLSGANLRWANLSDANLSGANLRWANLSDANLGGANLSDANLGGAGLSGATGVETQSEWLAENFLYTSDGLVVYRAQVGQYDNPSNWDFAVGNTLHEVVNPDRGTLCGCGVAFATLEWVRNTYPDQTIWECIIRPQYLAGIIVPFGTDGKARCECLELVRIVSK